MKSCNFWTGWLIFFILRYFAYNMMYYRISKNEKNLFFGKKIAQVWAVTLSDVKKIISNQCDLHFYECLAEYAASLNLRNVVWAR